MDVNIKEEFEFDRLLRDKNHKALIKLLGTMVEKLDKPAIEVSEVDISGIEKAISAISVTVEQDTVTVPKAIEAIGKVIIAKIENIKQEKQITKWDFKVTRDKKGLIQTVKAIGN